jgi:predicted acylesterase/phospholipase RssA
VVVLAHADAIGGWVVTESAADARDGSRLRLAVTLPGGASLGTFEAGAVCALVTAVQAVNAEASGAAVIDCIAGASAGALTGVLAARVLLAGDDPLPVFRRAWVTEPSLGALLGRGPWAPLTLRQARRVARSVLSAAAPENGRPPQGNPIWVDVALGSLRGFSYEIGRSRGRAPIRGTSYIDWGYRQLRPLVAGEKPDAAAEQDWNEIAHAALASAAHPLAFPATRLDREDVRSDYVENGITDLPAETPLRLWYTDGGLLENEPLGRCIKRFMGWDKGCDPRRLVVLVRPRPHQPAGRADRVWGAGRHPRWTETLVRSLDLLATHAVGEDLREVEKVNSRLEWTDRVARSLAGLVERDADQLRDELRPVLAKIEETKTRLAGPRAHPDRDALAGDDPATVIRGLLLAASGLDRKHPVDVAVVTTDPAAAPITGEGLLHRGRFLDARGRDRDFATGYWRMVAWMEDGRDFKAKLGDALARRGIDAAKARLPEPGQGRRARRRASRMSLATRLRLVRLSLRVLRIGAGDAIVISRRPRRAAHERARRAARA